MTKHSRVSMAVVLAVAAVTLMSCAPATPRARLTLVPVADFGAVAGKWTGLVRQGSAQPDEWVELTIQEDGAYRSSSAQTVGAFKESGVLRLEGGTLRSSSPTGSATYRLYYQGGARILVADYVAKDGAAYSAELTIAR